MAQIISASIDLMKIDKSKIIEGKKGQKYISISVIINDTKDQYDNDCAITLGQTKEEREAKEPKVYIGNGRTVWSNAQQAVIAPESVIRGMGDPAQSKRDDLPF